MTQIIYNEEYTDPLLGSLALETLLYVVDPAGERLVLRGTVSLFSEQSCLPILNRCFPRLTRFS